MRYPESMKLRKERSIYIDRVNCNTQNCKRLLKDIGKKYGFYNGRDCLIIESKVSMLVNTERHSR